MQASVARVVRTAYLDTNVYVEATLGGPLRAASRAVVQMAGTRRFGGVGSALLRRELQGVCQAYATRVPLELYVRSIVVEVPGGRRARFLGRMYWRQLGIKRSDAMHLALAVGAGADLFLSWNREDLVKRRTTEGLRQTNAILGLPVPLVLTPAQFLQKATVQGRRGRLSLR